MRAFLASSLAFALIAAPAAANPVLRYTWGPADALIWNQDFAGPQTYTQTLSVTGLSGAVTGFQVSLMYGPHYGPGSAWHAIMPEPSVSKTAPQPDCEGGPGFSVASSVMGATAIPGATATASYGCGEGVTDRTVICYMLINVTIDPPLIAEPGTRYGIATLELHHQNSAAGVTSDACDRADGTACFFDYSPYVFVDGSTVSLSTEGGLLSWQHSGPVDCFRAVTPTRPSSWGSIKTLYR